jgi:hypothetical protein
MPNNDKKQSRRTFVKKTSSWLGAAAAVSLANDANAANADSANVPPMPQAVLGRTGIRVSRLGIGCAQIQQEFITTDDVTALLHRAVELGVTYLDVAPNYGSEATGFSEKKMGPAIKQLRDKVFLVTKTEEPTYEGTWRLLKQSMKRLQTDHLDLVHIHNIGWVERFTDLDLVFSDKGALGALREAKKQGVIRCIGTSGHQFPSRFHDILDTGDIDAVMCAVNFVCRHTYDFEHKVFARARHDNVGLVAMKTLGGGDGRQRESFKLPNHFYEKALRYALSIPDLACAVVGMWNIDQLQKAADLVRRFKPLTPEESLDLAQQGLALAATEDWKAAYGLPLT